MSNRELVVLGTASQAPTRMRNHNGYFLRWDDEGLLFDPGEGTQRQMLFAGVTASQVTRVCITHFHGDHCLGLPGVLQRMSLDQVAHVVEVCYPAESQEVFGRLRHASLFRDRLRLRERRIGVDGGDGLVADVSSFRLEARPLSHSVPTVGYRLTEPDGRRMLPERLAAFGVTGPDIGHLQRDGLLVADGRTVTMEQVSEPRPGQRFAFIMDTRLCDAVYALADRADMLVCESTFANAEAALARDYGHLTAGQAGQVAARSGVRLLVLTHFSQRYESGSEGDKRLADEAAAAFGGPVVLARDLDRIPVPPRARLRGSAAMAGPGAEVRFAAELRMFLAPRHRGGQVRAACDGVSSLGHVVESFGVPLTEVGRLVVNGTAVASGYRLGAGDVAEAGAVRRPQPVPTARFILDVHLGTLARRLRLVGVDTAYANDPDDDVLIERANADRRVLLTQDRGLLRRRRLWLGAYVRGARPDDQLRDVLDRFAPPLAPWTRCTACNGRLAPACKADVEPLLQPGTRRTYQAFSRCGGCGKVYWHGAHGRRLEDIVAAAVRAVGG